MEKSGLVWDGANGRVCASERGFLAPSSATNKTTATDTHSAETSKLHGSCHCGKVAFSITTVRLAHVDIVDCNCSICTMTGYLHLTVPKHTVHITPASISNMTTYTFNTGVAQHTFCSTCGVKPLYIPRSNPDSYAVNLRCLQLGDHNKLPIVSLDGRNFTGRLDVK